MSEPLLVALISVLSVLLGALLTNWLSRRTQVDLARIRRDFEAENEEKKGAAAARRDYEYEAMKRLYTDVEPLLFQLYEALEEAQYRVASLCRTSRNGNLPKWLAGDGYYLRSTVYKLALPLAYLRLLQSKITFVDLGLDSSIYMRYLLLKLYGRSFTDDFDFAKLAPGLVYDPTSNIPKKLREENPTSYRRQGLVVGDLENVAALLVDGQRAKLFSEFEAALNAEPLDESLRELMGIFQGFSPVGRPVIARMLIVQGYLGKLLRLSFERKVAATDLPKHLDSLLNDSELGAAYSWGLSAEANAGPDQAREYLVHRLKTLLASLPG